MSIYQIITPIITVCFLILVFVLRSIIVWRRSGINPFVFGFTEKAHDYLGVIYKLAIALMALTIVLFSFFPKAYQFLNPIEYLERVPMKIVGVVMLVVSFIWTLIAQIQMANSWRIGIDYEEKTKLIETGLFTISRNPVFLGIVIFYVGIFLILPNTLSFSLVCSMYITVQVQVRLEEEYLQQMHNEEYVAYKKRVRRWW